MILYWALCARTLYKINAGSFVSFPPSFTKSNLGVNINHLVGRFKFENVAHLPVLAESGTYVLSTAYINKEYRYIKSLALYLPLSLSFLGRVNPRSDAIPRCKSHCVAYAGHGLRAGPPASGYIKGHMEQFLDVNAHRFQDRNTTLHGLKHSMRLLVFKSIYYRCAGVSSILILVYSAFRSVKYKDLPDLEVFLKNLAWCLFVREKSLWLL